MFFNLLIRRSAESFYNAVWSPEWLGCFKAGRIQQQNKSFSFLLFSKQATSKPFVLPACILQIIASSLTRAVACVHWINDCSSMADIALNRKAKAWADSGPDIEMAAAQHCVTSPRSLSLEVKGDFSSSPSSLHTLLSITYKAYCIICDIQPFKSFTCCLLVLSSDWQFILYQVEDIVV